MDCCSVLEAIGFFEEGKEDERQQQREDRLRQIALESMYRNRLLKTKMEKFKSTWANVK